MRYFQITDAFPLRSRQTYILVGRPTDDRPLPSGLILQLPIGDTIRFVPVFGVEWVRFLNGRSSPAFSLRYTNEDELEVWIQANLVGRAVTIMEVKSNNPQKEIDLLQKVHQSLPPNVRERYRELNINLHNETITRDEHQEFLSLVDQIELSDVMRLENLIELANLRGISLDELAIELGIGELDNVS